MARLALSLLVVVAVGVLPAAADAVVPGPNGPIAFTSGRDDGATTFSDANAQIWLLGAPGSSATRLTAGFNTFHHRHATWSPDRTKIAYARCAASACGFTGPWDIYVLDLAAGGPPLDITSSPESEDRPTWSPDGTRIAYAKQTAATSFDIKARAADGSGGETTVAGDVSTGMGASSQFARAQWTADSQSLVYGRIVAVNDYDIYRSPADGSLPLGTVVVAGATDDYQPAVSPDGEKICFTRDNGNGSIKNVIVRAITGGSETPITALSNQNYECSWSPDGTSIAFVRGAFGAGVIVLRTSSGAGETAVTDAAGRFDGNPDWTRNPPPACSNRTASVAFNGFVTIRLPCTDAPDPPSFQRETPDPEIVTGPAHGVLGSITDDGSVIYTPDANFTGTDSFTYKASDGTTDSPPATVTLEVQPRQPPAKATFKGTATRIRVTRKRRFKFSFHATPGLAGEAVFRSVKRVRVSRRKRVTLARKSFRVPPGGKRTLRLRLSKRNFRILKLNRKIRTRVTVTLRAGGLTSKARKRVTLLAPKRRR